MPVAQPSGAPPAANPEHGVKLGTASHHHKAAAPLHLDGLGGDPAAAPPMAPAGAKERGVLMLDLPHQVRYGESFDIDVWTRGLTSETEVFMEQTPDVSYQPRSVRVSDKRRATVKCKMLRQPPSGLLEINMSADGCADRSITIDAGFGLKLVRGDSTETMTLDSPQILDLSFVDEAGKSVALDGPLEMRIYSSIPLLREGPQSTPTNTLVKHIERRSAQAPYVWIAPSPRFGQLLSINTTDLAVELSDGFNDKILAQRFVVSILPPTWVQIAGAIAGSLVWMLISGTVQAERRGQKVSSAISAVLTGLIAFALVRVHVFGAKVDTTEVWGFFVLGALVNSSGVETFLRGLTSKAANAVRPAPGPAPATNG